MGSYPTEVPTEESQQIFANHQKNRQPHDINTTFDMVCRDCFFDANALYDQNAAITGFAGFCGKAFSQRSKLVVQYVIEAFTSLGCSFNTLTSGDELPAIRFDAKYKKLIPQLFKILRDADLITEQAGGQFLRTKRHISTTPASALFDEILEMFSKQALRRGSFILQLMGQRTSSQGWLIPSLCCSVMPKHARCWKTSIRMRPCSKRGTLVLT